MDILTLELLDVTVFQALLELRAQLAEHPGEALRVRGEDEMLRINVTGYLEKQGRSVRLTQPGTPWELMVAPAAQLSVPPMATLPEAKPRPVLLLRSAFAPGDRALGRRLLLETVAQLEPGTPWLCLAHQAVELLEDPGAVAILEGLRGRGIAIQVSASSLAHARQENAGFDLVQDEDWQRLLARGLLTVL
jgi:GNAT superfamily N-acetyltransferase